MIYEIIIIGAGPSGLCMSYFFNRYSVSHLVLEKGDIGETWRTQRWDHFKMVTPDKMNCLPGMSVSDGDKFGTAKEFVSSLKQLAEDNELPVKEHSVVKDVKKQENIYVIYALENKNTVVYEAKNMVVASGFQHNMFIPPFFEKIHPRISQIHSSQYKNAGSLPKGAVLVVGAGQSGIQIAEELLLAGRTVFLSTSKVGRVPRMYRGRDITDWMIEMGFYETRSEELSDTSVMKVRQPQIEWEGGISFQTLHSEGVKLMGTLVNAGPTKVFAKDNAAEHIKYADEYSANIKRIIDEYIGKYDLQYYPVEEEKKSVPATVESPCLSLNLFKNDINTIIWATGFVQETAYIKNILKKHKSIRIKDGFADIEGLYFIGLPWLTKRKSGIIAGIIEDAEYLAESIVNKTVSKDEIKINHAERAAE